DGAVGTELGKRGLDTRSPLFSSVALLSDEGRRILRDLHLEYLRAGADIVTAATFRTNRRALEAAGQGSRFPDLVGAAVAEGVPFGAYAHLGEMDAAVRWPRSPVLEPEAYADRAARWIERGATMIGGCCGTTPLHIAAVARRFGRAGRPGT